MPNRAPGLAVLSLLGGLSQNCGMAMGTIPPPTREETCLSSSTTWGISGLAPEQVPEDPDRLLKAQLRVGETVALQVSRLSQPGECDDLVRDVAWRSSVPAVASIAPEGALAGRLEALSPGESVVWADVTLQGGAVRRAELYAIPAGRTTRLRVHAVTVTQERRRR